MRDVRHGGAASEEGWECLAPAVYLVGGHRHTDETRIRATALWSGPEGIVCGPAAAYWHRMLDRPPAVVDLTVPGHRKPRPKRGSKGNYITRCAWDLLRYTWHGLDGRPGESVREISETLARAAITP